MKSVTMGEVIEVLNAAGELSLTEEQKETDITELGIDSIAFIKVVVALEEQFDCEIPDSKLILSDMNTLQKIYETMDALYEETMGRDNLSA
ncbi:MAG: acyl carrier protein [Lachnospiraceae bacterium]|nr:acyl carrier protein [Lachnospiraceae bacterium]